jgi:hypothetical protein
MESTLSARTNLQFALRNTKCLAFQVSRVKQKELLNFMKTLQSLEGLKMHKLRLVFVSTVLVKNF